MTGRNADIPRWTLRVNSTHEETRRARTWVGETLHDAGCTAEFIGDVLLAHDEALTNIVRHGYGGTRGRPIDVTVVTGPGWVDLLLEDEAPVFMGDSGGRLPDPADLAEGGYGIYLISTLMDESVREPRGECGNRLRLRKYQLDAEPRRSAS